MIDRPDGRPRPLDRRVCLVTGASGRLGTAFCLRYAGRYDIVAVYRSEPPPIATQAQRMVDPLDPGAALRENEHPVFAVRADLGRDQDIARVVELALRQFGGVDLLVNAAAHSVWGPMLESDQLLASAEAQFRINVLAPLRLAVALARRSWRDPEVNVRRRRNVVNVSSTAGIHVYRGSGQSVYAASKAALDHLTRHMAIELGALGVRVNAVAPNSFPRIVPTEWVADAIAELDASDVTGQLLVLDAAPGPPDAGTAAPSRSGRPPRA